MKCHELIESHFIKQCKRNKNMLLGNEMLASLIMNMDENKLLIRKMPS